MSTVLTAQAADGTIAKALVDGAGYPIVILHPGMNSPERYTKVSDILAKHYQIIRVYRYQYRQDLKRDPLTGDPCTVEDEVNHVLAITRELKKPALLFGHSSGGTVALETLLSSPESFVAGMIYEPALVLRNDTGFCLSADTWQSNGELGECALKARKFLQNSKPEKAMSLFIHYIAQFSKLKSDIAGALTAAFPAYRKVITCQIDDLEAMEHLGYRFDAYQALKMPVSVLSGEKSIEANKAMAFALADVLPNVERTSLSRQGHNSHAQDPEQLAGTIQAFAHKVFS